MIPREREAGFSVVETIVALLLLGLLAGLAWSTLSRQRHVGFDLAQRADGLETVRTVAWVLGEELSNGRQGLDWQVAGGDSLSLRAFRGIGLVEGRSGSPRTMTVCFRGIRSPAPEKDSLLLLGGDGRWRVVALEGRNADSAGCQGLEGWSREAWTVSQMGTDAVLARLFERGSYHLSGGALRYRRGRGGRQPLTPEVIEDGSFLAQTDLGWGTGWEITLRRRTRSPGLFHPDAPEPLLWRGTVW